ncbi:wax synthase family protein [Aspergillus clavatus NRRL 1]|uniref:Wax synthase domain-containing protein n=1 Tax=Aspergillus clavatus (strain ATCC 1007 / CBS 513.65 / DSM 816 / NCTC 3887 / NRRL 1 / QM 1276 / 107) TaxID=344612 RepID=A1C9Z9_ASPCL|nr:uncharacterized protein ACLA_009900 [Aspergillus clavatus NRRL 1]EAW12567.1 conserved hypothetical protein [Aspergillus clavatus NRRL 1]
MADHPSSYRQVLLNNRRQFEHLIEQGDYKPFYLWHLLVFTALPLTGLLISRRSGSRYVRPVISALILGTAVDVIRHRRALLGGNGYMGGLVTAWWAIWSATILVFNDAERDFKRIERSSSDPSHPIKAQGAENGNPTRCGDEGSNGCVAKAKQDASRLGSETLIWQPYPHALRHRLNWALGLLFNMRGPEWSWRISTLDPLPASLQAQQTTKNGRSARQAKEKRDGTVSWPGPRARLHMAFVTFVKHYLFLDLLKVLMMYDPYFWGIDPPASILPSPVTHLPAAALITRFYRLLLSAFGVFAALSFVNALNPLVFLGLSLAFPNASRALTRAPLDAPWLYSPAFGPFRAPILDSGLAGCWSQWWHQLFRFGFTSTAHWLLALLPRPLAAQTTTRRVAMTLVAFSLSGLIHACGSYTQFAHTTPLTGPFLFFLLQAVGVLLQTGWVRLVARGRCSRRTGRAANAAFVFAWLLFSGGLIADDFARGGLWLTEPLPVSPLRGLGFGAEGDGWWCWRDRWFTRWEGGGYWERGVRVF